MNKIVRVHVVSLYETCERTTFYVVLTTDEGFTMEASGHATGSVYTNHEGLSVEEARDRALIDAADWGDFLGITPDPYVGPDDVTYEPSMTLDRYSNRRARAERKRIKEEVSTPQ